jgi:ABC-type oligopeptide transport system substrate-binding subunit
VADYPDPDGFFRGLVRQPFGLLRDGELDELLDDARAIRDPAERIRRYHEIDRLLAVDRALVLPVAYGRSMILRRPWVTDLRTHPMTGIAFDEARVTRG